VSATTKIKTLLAASCVLALGSGCVRVPNALNPGIHGSIGNTSSGFLTDGIAIKNDGDVRWLRPNDRHFGIPRFVASIERAAHVVAGERRDSILVTADLSRPRGGRISPHLSHAAGRDADILLFATTLDGAPVQSPGFVSFDEDGIGWDKMHGRYLRFDVEREWLFIKAMLEDEDARVQWIFISEVLKAIVVEYARARGDDPDTILHAMEVMHQPHPGGVHDDHVHVRTDCSPDDLVFGCEHTGPWRAWHKQATPDPDKDLDLVMEIAKPIPGSAPPPDAISLAH
jgi:penicillin-insensitive murein endopeptidase